MRLIDADKLCEEIKCRSIQCPDPVKTLDDLIDIITWYVIEEIKKVIYSQKTMKSSKLEQYVQTCSKKINKTKRILEQVYIGVELPERKKLKPGHNVSRQYIYSTILRAQKAIGIARSFPEEFVD